MLQDINKRLSLPTDLHLPKSFISKQLESPDFMGPLSRASRRQSLSEIGFGRSETYIRLNKLGQVNSILKFWKYLRPLQPRTGGMLPLFTSFGRESSNPSTECRGRLPRTGGWNLARDYFYSWNSPLKSKFRTYLCPKNRSVINRF